jgi:ribosome-associated protein
MGKLVPPVPLGEIQFDAVLAQGAGGQNVNKTASAAVLRLDIRASSLPEDVKARLLALRDRRISSAGVVIIKAQQHRSLERNRAAALQRLRSLLASVAEPPRPRRATRPTAAARRKRLEGKAHRARIKSLRRRIED